MRISPEDRQKLFKQVRHRLGAPIRKIQLEDEQMESLLEIATEDYIEYIQNYIIEHQWPSLIGLNINEADLTRAFVTRSSDLVTQYTYSYSKIVGLQSSPLGDWELKKDFITLERNKQIYEIPAGREINELLWFTPATQNNMLFDPWSFGPLGGPGLGGPGGYSQMGGAGSYFMTSAFDMLLRMQEINIQRRIIGGDLTYRITGLPNGKKAIHLMQTPGGKFDFGNSSLMGSQVWYWYYDVGPQDRDSCLAANPDIIKLPSDVPMNSISWADLNEPAQQWVRRYFVASCKETLSKVRGKYSGNLKTPDSELTMDYATLSTEGKDEKTKLIEELIGADGRLTRLRPEKIMEREALIAENLNKQMKFRAFPRNLYVI